MAVCQTRRGRTGQEDGAGDDPRCPGFRTTLCPSCSQDLQVRPSLYFQLSPARAVGGVGRRPGGARGVCHPVGEEVTSPCHPGRRGGGDAHCACTNLRPKQESQNKGPTFGDSEEGEGGGDGWTRKGPTFPVGESRAPTNPTLQGSGGPGRGPRWVHTRYGSTPLPAPNGTGRIPYSETLEDTRTPSGPTPPDPTWRDGSTT